MDGLGKQRSKFGKYLDHHSITQNEIAKRSGVGRTTISRLSTSDEELPTLKNAKKILNALRLAGYSVGFDDLWDI